MEKLQVISHPQFGQLSVIIIDGKEYFKAKECAQMLGYSNLNDAIARHCKGVVKRDLPSKSGKQTFNLISEGDLWRLIIRSKLPQAEEIERWIMDEVLPTIRKTGSYTMSQQSCRQMTFDDYSYFDKTWGGEPVVTIHDIAHLSGLDRTSIGDTIRRELIEHEEYCLLERKALGQFKAENPKLPRNIPSLIIVNRRGFERICEIYGLEIEKPKCLAVEEKKRSSQIITPTITRQSEEIRRMAERLIHLTYLLDDTHGQILCGETFHQCRMAVIRQMKEIGSCIVVPRKEN